MTPLRKLFQKSHIPLKKQLNVIDAVLQNRDAVDAHAKSKPADLRRVVAVVLHELEDVRVNHATAENLDPASGLAGTARFTASSTTAATNETADHHLGARLGEREERGPKLRFHARSEQRFH